VGSLLLLWRRLLGQGAWREPGRRPRSRLPVASDAQVSETIFLVMRRMRAPLIILILIFATSVVGLTLVPGRDEAGQVWRMTFFDAFYFMSYTATTIGFGEIPHDFTYGQRLWVIASIYLTVVGWAYAIGSLLTLLQDRAFRNALALHRFGRKVSRLREPFLLLAGYGQTGELLGRSFDALGRRFVVLDSAPARIDALDLAAYHVDVPALVGDARNPNHLIVAGLHHPACAGVLALTDDDEVNLAVTMAATLLRPDLPVVARDVSPLIGHRLAAFGTPTVVNPFDRFGTHLRLALGAPSSYQLLSWLEHGPGAELPEHRRPPTDGRWVICGYGRFGQELAKDLRSQGLDVTIIEPRRVRDDDAIMGDASEPATMARADLEEAVGFVAGTDNDTTNLSLLAAARRTNHALFLAARQNQRANAPLFAAMQLDALLVPAEVVAQEIYAQLSTPLLWRFLQEMPAQGDAWAAELVARLTGVCGPSLQAVWKLRLTESEAPALQHWLASGEARLGDLLRNPENRDTQLHAVVLLALSGSQNVLTPGPDFLLSPGDQLLLVGWPAARRALETTLAVEAVMQYVVSGLLVPSSWVWRRLSRRTRAGRPVGAGTR
jgi:voltage-gated potassium channel